MPLEVRPVGSTDLHVSVLGLGTVDFGGRLDEPTAGAIVDAALEEGVTLFDTGDNYNDGRSEEILGRALRGRREGVVVSTKFTGKGPRPFCADGSRSHVIEACEGSLRRLGMDCIDLYCMHHPDPRTPIEETLQALGDLVEQGKVRHAACSNFAGWQVAESAHVAATAGVAPFVVNQVEWNLLKRHVEAEAVPACLHYGVSVMPFYPIASGLLTGRYRRHEDFPKGSRFADVDFYARVASPQNFERVERLAAFAEARGRSLLELAMSWLASQPVVCSVLVGASRPEQLRSNVAAASWRLTRDDFAEIDALLTELQDPGVQPFNRVS